ALEVVRAVQVEDHDRRLGQLGVGDGRAGRDPQVGELGRLARGLVRRALVRRLHAGTGASEGAGASRTTTRATRRHVWGDSMRKRRGAAAASNSNSNERTPSARAVNGSMRPSSTPSSKTRPPSGTFASDASANTSTRTSNRPGASVLASYSTAP